MTAEASGSPASVPNVASWHQGLACSFQCAGRLAVVSLCPLRGPDGELRWDVRWTPGPPLRMLSTDFEDFAAGERAAHAAIRAHLAGMVRST